MMRRNPNPHLAWPIAYSAVCEIGEHEGFALKAYPCQAKKWTCGWGETSGVGPNTVWTEDYADQRFRDSLAEVVRLVLMACKVEPTANQLAALVSFAYNYGGWKTSTVMKAHNRGDFAAAARAFALVNKFTNPATGKLEVSNGLTARRAKEAARYLTPTEGAHPIPQEVAPESSMGASPINQAGAGGAVVATITAASQQVDAIKGPLATIKGMASDVVSGLAIPAELASYVPWIIVATLGTVVVYQRIKQRRQGWA